MKIYLRGVLVVEGKEDISYLSNYIGSEMVAVNGFELDKSIISYLKDKEVLALLDPDEAGKQIRSKLNKEIPNITNIEVDINRCKRGKKTGIAECEIEEVIKVLNPYICGKEVSESNIKHSDLFELDLLSNKKKRFYLCTKLNLGTCNGKQLLKRLYFRNVSYEQLIRAMEGYENDH